MCVLGCTGLAQGELGLQPRQGLLPGVDGEFEAYFFTDVNLYFSLQILRSSPQRLGLAVKEAHGLG
jgi:hypothetical protein